MRAWGPRRRLLSRRTNAAVLTAWVASVPAAPLGAEIIDRLLAVVDGQIITLSDVRAAQALGLVSVPEGSDPIAAALDRLIERELMLAEVQRYLPPEPDPAVIDARLADVRARFGSDEGLRAALSSAGMDLERLRGWVRNDLRIDQYLVERFESAGQPSDEEVKAYVSANRDELMSAGRSVEEASAIARARLAADRRSALVADWLGGLRRRADIVQLYLPTP